MARLSFRCDDELVARVDAARGDVARERWLRRLVEREVMRGETVRSEVEAEARALMGPFRFELGGK